MDITGWSPPIPGIKWWAWRDSNPQIPVSETGPYTNSSTSPRGHPNKKPVDCDGFRTVNRDFTLIPKGINGRVHRR